MAGFALIGGLIVSSIYAWPVALLMIFTAPIVAVFMSLSVKIEFGITSGIGVSIFANAT